MNILRYLLLVTLAGCAMAQDTSPSQNEREVSENPKQFARNFFSDQKMIWTFPAKLNKPSRFKPTLLIFGITGALIPPDPPIARAMRRNAETLEGVNSVFSENNNTAATLLTPAAFYVAGWIKKDSYLKKTGLLAAEAWVNVDLTNIALRSATRRLRPLDVPPNGNFTATWSKTNPNPLKAAGSFPSGHSAWVFAIATVVARRHSNHKWVPWVAYGAATAASLTRITSSNHFVSDTFFGAALGYSIGRFVVLRQ
jgi:membrane-associated phospholipid phosphatase